MTTSSRRVASIDVLRGVIMIVMALDHTRDFFGAVGINPTDPARTTVALFFTRWITHFCAPVFFLLTGTGAFLSIGRRTRGELAWLLVTRGAWLIVLELTFVRCFGYQFNVDYRVTMLVVLWALGWSMICLAALVRLPPFAVATIGALMIATHNLFDSLRAASLGTLAPLWSVLHAPNVVLATPRMTVFVAYPLIPWVGVTAMGYGLGAWYRQSAERRQAALLRAGSAMAAAFVILRFMNIYGDPVRWSAQRSPMFTMLSFLNATKYPPSLLFLLMTLGPALLALWMLERGTPLILRAALVYGQVPLFYFVLHLTVIHLLAVVVCEARYGDAHWMFQSPSLDRYPFTQPPGWGFPLPIVYAAWISVVALLYPACAWYAAVKTRRRRWWLSYL